MKSINFKNSLIALLSIFLLINFGCAREIDELELATFPKNGEVFIDGFSGGLEYAAFGGSKVTAFDVDTDIKYSGTASMRIAVPDVGDSQGAYAGGTYFTGSGRDLSDFDALTFWARASKAATIDVVGFGNDLGENRYQTALSGVAVNTNWKKYYIPIPDPSKLTEERGMFFYSEGAEEGKGYTFWIDEVQFETLGTIAHPEPAILEGQDQVIPAATGDDLTIGGGYTIFNLPTGANQRVETASSYFDFTSSDTNIATVSSHGIVSVIDSGEVVITAKLMGVDAIGSLTVGSRGQAVQPIMPAPTPTQDPDSVISLFSNAYNDVVVDTWNPFWEFSTALNFDLQVDGDDIKQYKQLNFVGIEFTSNPIDAREMTHFHLDIWTPDPTNPSAAFKVLLVDFGANGIFDGGDDSGHEIAITSPTLQTEQWVSLDIPLASFSGLASKEHLAQLVLSGDIPNVYIDNVYFYSSGEDVVIDPTGPQEPAPMPTESSSDVISLFSNTYSDVPVDTWNPFWEGSTTLNSDLQIAGDDMKKYEFLNFVGIEFVSQQIDATDMTHFHINVWSPNPTNSGEQFKVLLVDFGGDGGFDGGDDSSHELSFSSPTLATGQWVSLDIPLANFSGLTSRRNLAQLVLSGDLPTVYVDNVYFYKGEGNTGGGDTPTAGAPEPTHAEGDVISVFSDAYTNVSVEDYNPNWGQATVVTEVSIGGNNTFLYKGLNYQGIQLNGSQDVSGMNFLHIDFWTSNSSALNTFIISPGPVETAYALPVPTSGWVSVDIPLSDFLPVDLADVFQFKFDGNGDIYLDNIYFHK